MLVRFGYPEDIVVNLVKALQARGDEIVAFEIQKEVSRSLTLSSDVGSSRLSVLLIFLLTFVLWVFLIPSQKIDVC